MLTITQKQTVQSIVNVFETSQVRGDYGKVTLIAGDTGHLTFGRSQTTLGSGNLAQLVQRYCAIAGARFQTRLSAYLPRLAARDTSLDAETKLHNLLRASADDPVMRDSQDAFFEDVYWQPAARSAQRLGIATALGTAVVYDSFVQGSWQTIKKRTDQRVGTLAAIGETAWVSGYVTTRRDWLASHPRADLRATVYRMDAFRRLIDQGYWNLDLPLVVRGHEISAATLAATPAGCFDGPQPGTRVLSVQSPLLRGLDVRLVQLGLSDEGADIMADGIFGQTTARFVKAYQAAHELPATGVADLEVIARLVG